MNLRLDTDVLIVGGGPAGLAASIALRQRGIDCTVVEAGAPGIDKACGEGLMPDTRAALSALGVDVSEADGYAFRGIRFLNEQHRADASFPDGSGIGVRRPVLHRKLAAAAEHAGVSLRWNSRVKFNAPVIAGRQTATIAGQEIGFRWLIGADGHASGVRRWAGLDDVRKETLRYGFRRHYQVKPWSEYVEVYWGPAGQFYVTPVAEDCVCVVYVTRDRSGDRSDSLPMFPQLADRLRGAAIVSQERGAVSATRKLRRVANDSVALIGDASGSTDSITGEGMALTFRQARALAESISGGSLKSYAREHRRIGRLPHAMGRLMLTMDRWPGLEARATRALATSPDLFRDLLSVHVGEMSRVGFALTRGPRLGWNLLARA